MLIGVKQKQRILHSSVSRDKWLLCLCIPAASLGRLPDKEKDAQLHLSYFFSVNMSHAMLGIHLP